jgi:hypothetical protein
MPKRTHWNDKMMNITYKLVSVDEKLNIISIKLKHSHIFKRAIN